MSSLIQAVTHSLSINRKSNIEASDPLYLAISQVQSFLKSPNKILIITGMIGTGLEELISEIGQIALKDGRNFTVLAPNRRIALRYQIEADSIYTHIFQTKNPKLEQEKFVYELATNKETSHHLYIVGDAHLISDSKFETDDLRHGSGQLLTDFLNFSGISDSQRQIIFLGDPFQLLRGKVDESALCKERLQSFTSESVKEIYLDAIIPERQNCLFVTNALKLAQCIKEGVFNELQIETNDLQAVEAPLEESCKKEVLRELFIAEPRATKFAAFSHADVNTINNWVRRKVFKREALLTAGDVVQIHNSFRLLNKDFLECPIYVSKGTFAEIITVNNVAPIIQQLKGYDRPIIIELLEVSAILFPDFNKIKFLCLKNYLYSEKPELEKSTQKALKVFTESRFKKLTKSNLNNDKEAAPEDNLELANFFRDDPYFNAARLRFGYAFTLHSAEGQKFKTVVGNLETGQGQTNENYFRYVYTLFSIAEDKIILSNIPSITPFSKAAWDDSFGKIDSIRPHDLVAFNPDGEAGDVDVPSFSIPEKALRNLYWYIVNIARHNNISIASYKHHNYQEVYGFQSQDCESCSLRLYYNGKYRVTRIETVSSSPSNFAKRIHYFLTSNIRFETDFQKKIFNFIKKKLDSSGISIKSIEHHDFQEVYYLEWSTNAAKLQIYYDGEGFVTRIIPVAYTSLEIKEQVRSLLGV